MNQAFGSMGNVDDVQRRTLFINSFIESYKRILEPSKPPNREKKWKPSKIRRFQKRSKTDFSEQRTNFGRFQKRYSVCLPKSNSLKLTKLSSKQRRNKNFREAMASGKLILLDDINVLNSLYKEQYKNFPKGEMFWVKKDEFLIVSNYSPLYATFERSPIRPHPKAREYLQEMIAKRRLYEVVEVYYEDGLPRARKGLVEQQDKVIEQLLHGTSQTKVFSSIAELVASKQLNTRKIRQDEISLRRSHRAGKNRPSKRKRSAKYKLHGLKFLQIESRNKRKSLQELDHDPKRRK
jgi:hypothetical protein